MRIQDLDAAIIAVGEVPCASAPDVFFPDYADAPLLYTSFTNSAKRLCQECPIISECLSYALEAREEYGVWGGTSPADRKAMLRRERLGAE